MYKKLIFAALISCNAFAYAQDEVERIAPDRPGFGDAVGMSPVGQLQLETGVQLEQSSYDEDLIGNIFSRDISINSTLLRYGINERFEARFDYNILRNSIGVDGEEMESVVGLAPCRLGLKAHILKNKGIIPELAFISMIGFPWTATEEFRPTGIKSDWQLSFSNAITEKFSICYNLGLSWDGNSVNPQNYYALSAECYPTEKFGFYVQGRGYTQKVANLGGSDNLYYTALYSEGGIMFYPRPHIQIDLSGGALLTDHLSDNFSTNNPNYFFITAGLSWRFGDK